MGEREKLLNTVYIVYKMQCFIQTCTYMTVTNSGQELHVRTYYSGG